MARYTMDQLYDKYVENYDKKSETTLMTKKFTRTNFEDVYNAVKASGTKSNITREILQHQDILGRNRLKEIAATSGTDVKALRKMFKDIGAIEEKYSDYEFIPFSGSKVTFGNTTSLRHQFSDAQMFFATLIDAGWTEEQAKAAYGY